MPGVLDRFGCADSSPALTTILAMSAVIVTAITATLCKAGVMPWSLDSFGVAVAMAAITLAAGVWAWMCFRTSVPAYVGAAAPTPLVCNHCGARDERHIKSAWNVCNARAQHCSITCVVVANRTAESTTLLAFTQANPGADLSSIAMTVLEGWWHSIQVRIGLSTAWSVLRGEVRRHPCGLLQWSPQVRRSSPGCGRGGRWQRPVSFIVWCPWPTSAAWLAQCCRQR